MTQRARVVIDQEFGRIGAEPGAIIDDCRSCAAVPQLSHVVFVEVVPVDDHPVASRLEDEARDGPASPRSGYDESISTSSIPAWRTCSTSAGWPRRVTTATFARGASAREGERSH